ncbi:DUF3221 domain-containing protein [Paenibacillus sp. GSMTC-2017]|uniref:DUF3221 domain-containing protein n=1 Tax=Paenibacillus sp. GSMTC-2017 TaxID=2794350 RepID=UPI0018D5CEE8|nr:DUF3221 domain-containing protein [Paenibacillus sp. GSMTC-2017]
MKRIIALTTIVIAIIFLNACSTQEKVVKKESQFEYVHLGYITKLEDHRALVVSTVNSETNPNKEYYEAIWVSAIPSNLKVGQQVQVKLKGNIATSYPAQAGAEGVSITTTQKPEGADTFQDEVIRKALLDKELASVDVLVIKEVSYDVNSDSWTIRYKEAMLKDGILEEKSIVVLDK